MKFRLQKGFTLIELLVVIAIIGILSAVVLVSLSSARTRAQNTRRLSDMRQIYTALVMYQNQYGCLPRTNSSVQGNNNCGNFSYKGYDTGGWDYSSMGDFIKFLTDSGTVTTVPVDPVNSATEFYKYHCYPVGYVHQTGTPAYPKGGLWLGWVDPKATNRNFNYSAYIGGQDSSTYEYVDTNFDCK